MSFWRRREVQGLLLMLPFLILFSMFVLFPLIQTVILSFSGGENLFSHYLEAFSIPRFRQALFHTLGMTLISAALVTLLSLPTAFLIQKITSRHPRARHLLALPYATSMMSLSLTNLMFFNGQNSLLNKLIPLFNLTPRDWLSSSGSAFFSVLVLMLWYGYGYTTFVCLLTMDSLPAEPYEAATIAGATHWQAFRYITLPQVLPSLGYVIPTTIIAVLTMFEPVLALYYSGMDVNLTTSLTYVFYQQAFSGSNPGLACAMACVLIVPVLLCCYLYMRYVLHNRTAR